MLHFSDCFKIGNKFKYNHTINVITTLFSLFCDGLTKKKLAFFSYRQRLRSILLLVTRKCHSRIVTTLLAHVSAQFVFPQAWICQEAANTTNGNATIARTHTD